MTKKTFLTGMLAILLVFSMAVIGCDNGGSSSPSPRDAGVLGNLTGVLYDPITYELLSGVIVTLDGNKSFTTKADGAYLFEEVGVGDHDLTFSKDGYRAQRVTYSISPETYKKDDPFLEYHALMEQLKALQTWAADDPNIPEYGTSGGTYTWTYQDGVFINGDGTAVTVNKDGQFEISQIKMDYTYVKSFNVGLSPMMPLSGAISGKIMLFTTPVGEIKNAAIDEAIPITEGVQLWFSSQVGVTAVTYGSAMTDADGGYSFAGLPVGENITITINGFVLEDGNAFKQATTIGNGDVYTYDFAGNNFVNTAVSIVPENNGINAEAQTYTNVEDLYLFTSGNFAVITENDTGTPNAPKGPNDPLKLTFNKAIDTTSFLATLTLANVKADDVGEVINFNATWEEGDTVVILKPVDILTGQLAPALPYSIMGSKTIGELNILGRAQDGSKIFADNSFTPAAPDPAPAKPDAVGIPVFTAEGLKLTGFEINPDAAAIPARAVVITKEAVKLTFSKELNKELGYAKFAWGGATLDAGKAAEYKITDDGLSVFVYTDLLAADDKLHFSVTAKDDPYDVCAVTNYGNASGGFTKPSLEKMTLMSTNIYANHHDSEAVNNAETLLAAYANDANFPLDGKIELTFTKAVSPTAQVLALVTDAAAPESDAVFNSTDTIPAGNIVKDGKKLTITPNKNLIHAKAHYLALKIVDQGESVFDSARIAEFGHKVVVNTAGGAGSEYHSILFKTVSNEMKLVSTNIYDNHSLGTADNEGQYADFDNTKIELTFVKIPEDVIVRADLIKTTAPTGAGDIALHNVPASKLLPFSFDADRKKLTLDLESVEPAGHLDYGTDYYLVLNILDKQGTVIFNSNSLLDTNTIVDVEAGVGGYKSIYFRTAKHDVLKLTGTNIYANYDLKADYLSPKTIEAQYARFKIGNPAAAPIKLTFDKAVPENVNVKIVLTAIAAPANINAPSMKETVTYEDSRKTMVITPNTRLQYSTTVYLTLEIFDIDKGEMIFDNEQLLESEDIRKFAFSDADGDEVGEVGYTPTGFHSICFQTEDDPASFLVGAQTYEASGGGTSAEFYNDITSTNYITRNSIEGGTIKLGKPYYVHFTDDVEYTFPVGKDTGANGVYKTTNTRIEIKVSFEGAVMTIIAQTPVGATPITLEDADVDVAFDGTSKLFDLDAENGGTINTDGDNFYIHNLTVTP